MRGTSQWNEPSRWNEPGQRGKPGQRDKPGRREEPGRRDEPSQWDKPSQDDETRRAGGAGVVRVEGWRAILGVQYELGRPELGRGHGG